MPEHIGEFVQALAKYDERLTEKPQDTRTLCNRSFVLLKLDRFEDALKDADFCIAIDKHFAKGYVRRAQALEKLGQESEALKVITKALNLDANDESALRLLQKLDAQLQAGIAVLDQLRNDAAQRRNAVRAMLQNSDQLSIFQQKWAQFQCTHKKLILRMLYRGLEEIKYIFIDAFQPLEAILQHSDNRIDLNLLQQEILATTIVVSSDLVTCCEDDDKADTAKEQKCRHDILDCITAAAHDQENTSKVCGAGMFSLMDAYRFPAFRRHPRHAELSLDLIKLQRSTLILVVAHLLLGGDGLPTVVRNSEECFKDDTTVTAEQVAPAKQYEDMTVASLSSSTPQEQNHQQDEDDDYSDDLCSPQSDDSEFDRHANNKSSTIFFSSFRPAAMVEAK